MDMGKGCLPILWLFSPLSIALELAGYDVVYGDAI